MEIEAQAVYAAKTAQVSSLMSDLARRDVSNFSPAHLMEAHDAVARLWRLAGTLQARFAGEIARRSTPDLPGGGLARQQGFGNAGMMVSRVTGGSQAGAMRSIEAGLALMPAVEPAEATGPTGPTGPDLADSPPTPRYPAVAEASLAGDLSVDAAGLIVAGLETIADRVPSDRLHALERRLVDKAIHLAVHEVRRLVATAIARADLPGHKERERRQYSDRYLAWKEDHTGTVTFSAKLDAVTAAPIRTVIEQMVTHKFRARRDQDVADQDVADQDVADQDPTEPDQRTVGQMRADALFELCRHALGCRETDQSGIRTTIVVRMNKRDIDTGSGLGSDTGSGLGSIDGTTVPVSIGQLRRLAGDAGIIPAVLSGDSEVLDLGRKVRMFTRAQRLALVERDGGCAKCHAPPEHCEAHHIHWWDKGGRTDLSNGVMLCTRCHHDIHRQGWQILIQHGQVNFIPPPTIDPTRQPRPGGRAAIDIGEVSNLDEVRDLDPPARDPSDNPAQNHAAWQDPAWQDPASHDPASHDNDTAANETLAA